MITHNPFKFLEQVRGEKDVMDLYLKIITVFQDFSYLFDGILVLLHRVMDGQTECYLLIPALLFCSATSHGSPHSPLSIIPPSFYSF